MQPSRAYRVGDTAQSGKSGQLPHLGVRREAEHRRWAAAGHAAQAILPLPRPRLVLLAWRWRYELGFVQGLLLAAVALVKTLGANGKILSAVAAVTALTTRGVQQVSRHVSELVSSFSPHAC